MKNKRSLSVRFYFILPVFCVLAFTASAEAQAPTDSRPNGAPADREFVLPASLLRGGPMGELMSVYTPRDPDEIDRLLDVARSLRGLAEDQYAESSRIADAADGRVRIMNEELQTTKTRLSVAKKASNEADTGSLNVDVKRQETEKNYLGRLRDALNADAAWLNSQRVAAAAQVKSLELEGDVARKHADILAATEENRDDISNYIELLKQMLNARKEAGDRGSDAGARQNEAAARKLKQLDALSTLNR